MKKGKDWFQQSISERTLKNLWRSKSTFARDGGENSSKKTTETDGGEEHCWYV